MLLVWDTPYFSDRAHSFSSVGRHRGGYDFSNSDDVNLAVSSMVLWLNVDSANSTPLEGPTMLKIAVEPTTLTHSVSCQEVLDESVYKLRRQKQCYRRGNVAWLRQS